MVLLPFMDIFGVSKYLLQQLEDVPQTRMAYASHGRDIPEEFSGRVWITLSRFLELSQEARKMLSEKHLAPLCGQMALCLYFTQLDAQAMFDHMDDIELPYYKRMRDITNGQVEILVVKLQRLIYLMQIAK